MTNNVFELRESRGSMPTAPLPSACPEWCEHLSDEAGHAHASPRSVFRDVDPDGDVLCAFTVRAAQVIPGATAWVDLRAWHAGGPGQPPSDVEALLSPAEARELAGLLTEAAGQAEQCHG